MKKKMSNRDKTFWAVVSCNLIFCIQYTSNDQRCDLQLYKL